MDLAVVVDNSEREEPVQQRVPLSMITLDEVLQPRKEMSSSTVRRYVEVLEDGGELPPLEVVYDGITTWLAKGFHRYMAHKEVGLVDAECIVHFGSKTDALRLSVGSNARHGQPRTGKDLLRSYDLAALHRLFEPWDAAAVRRTLGCTRRQADELTQRAREQRDADRLHRIVELRTKGWSWARIGKVVGLTDQAVGNIIATLPYDPKFGPPSLSEAPKLGETEPEPQEAALLAPEPDPPADEPVPVEELDLEAGEPDVLEEAAVGGPAEGTPLEDYIKQQRETREQRMMWFEALEALERFGKLPTPERLFENRDDSYDHLIGPALDAADAWIVAMGERWDAEKAQ